MKKDKYQYKFFFKKWVNIILFPLLLLFILPAFFFMFDYFVNPTSYHLIFNLFFTVMAILGIWAFTNIFILRVPAIGITNEYLVYSNSIAIPIHIRLEDIKKVTINQTHYNERIEVTTKYRTYKIDTKSIEGSQETIKKAIMNARKK